jgi:hypothetical protein
VTYRKQKRVLCFSEDDSVGEREKYSLLLCGFIRRE